MQRRRATTGGERAGEEARIWVSVHAPGGAHFTESARVSLRLRGRSIALQRAPDSLLYEGTVEPGTYTLEVSAGPLRAPRRSVTVTAPRKTASAYLGEREWPFYRLGENVVPFEPRDDLIAVAFEARPPGPQEALRLVERLRNELPLEPLVFQPGENLPFIAAQGAIWLFQLTDPDARERMGEAIPHLLVREARVGIPVDLIPGQVKVLDNRFVVRFRDHLKPDEIQVLVDAAGGTILRDFIQAGNARLVAFRRGGYRQHLQTVEEWFAKSLLVYGEPDLLAEIRDDVFPADPPNDPTYPQQANLTLQDVDEAWVFLNGINPNLTLGSPNVYVATLDRGVQTGHPDVGGNLTDGTAQLGQCYDFAGLQACTAAGYGTDTSHGMGVYGIIAARTNNGTAVAGIAPNTHQIGLKRPGLTSVNYPDILLWAAGFDTGNTSAGWPAEPISPAAAIISCSHGVDGLALSGIMDDTFQYLATYGRGGRGTMMIYSAGNSNALITGFRTWAAHPRTLAIANSRQPNAMGVETKDPTSNFGPEIDLCAQGTNAPSLDDNGGEQVFGGTSAAAPTVAAAAGLMLSVEPALTWIQLRDLLRGTAVIIDPANADPIGQWVGGFSQWYGFGRLDVNDAVQGADGYDLGAVNLLMRDNLADDGMLVPTGGTFWDSPDLWVRTGNPATDPIGDPAYNVDPPHENAIGGADNWIRSRVKNVGTGPSSDFYLRAYLTHFAGSQFQYPTDYIPSINTGDPLPSPLVQATYLIGEVLGTGLGAGAEQIFNFLWPAAMVPPETVGGTEWHPCLLAEVTPHTGPAPSGNLVVDYSNLAQRNVTISYNDDAPVNEMTGVIGHEDDDARVKRIVVQRGRLPKRAKIWVRFLDRRVEAAVLKQMAEEDRDAVGRSPREQEQPARGARLVGAGQVVIEPHQGRRRFCLTSGSRLVLDVPMVAGRLTPVVLGALLPEGTPHGAYELPLIEQDLAGRSLGAFSLEIVVR
jgi:hypothetical protein